MSRANRRRAVGLRPAVGALVTAALLSAAGCDRPMADGQVEAPTRALAEVLRSGDDATGFARVEGPRTLEFPADHGAHPDHRIEWWYVTGHLETDDGQRFGYQFTLFRSALRPTPRRSTSAWAADQLYMAHFAVTEIDAGRFHAFERFSRGGAGLAGVTTAPFEAWLEGWSLASVGAPFLPLRLRAAQGGIEIDLELAPGKPIVLHGERGYSPKSADRSAASHYYSYTRLPTHGHLRTEHGAWPVRGDSWLDREWTTSLLDPEQIGWDWFSLQLEDGHELMYFQLRRRDGTIEPAASGTWVRPDGSTVSLTHGQVELTVERSWDSPSGRRYPVAWRLRCRELELDLGVEAAIPNQEHAHSIAYWEGAVTATGSRAGDATTGRGYAELTGYR